MGVSHIAVTAKDIDALIAFWDLSNVPGCENPRTDLNRDHRYRPS